jgi:hypothetical protein
MHTIDLSEGAAILRRKHIAVRSADEAVACEQDGAGDDDVGEHGDELE